MPSAGLTSQTLNPSVKWVLKAKDKGATLIHVDPRFTRTSSSCHHHVGLRPGSDIAFLGGMIKYILDNKLYFADYVRDYTNGSLVVNKNYNFKNGLFAGFDPKAAKYDSKVWAFELDEKCVPVRDASLGNPRCVLNLLREHYKRYTVAAVAKATGTQAKDLEMVYRAFAATGRQDKAGTILYAMGWTHGLLRARRRGRLTRPPGQSAPATVSARYSVPLACLSTKN